VSCLAAELWTK